MFAFIASVIFAASVNASAPKQTCEWVGPRIDGLSVLLCDGSVKAYRDASGYVLSTSEGK